MIALEKAKTEKEAHGEFEGEHPGSWTRTTPASSTSLCETAAEATLQRLKSSRSLTAISRFLCVLEAEKKPSRGL